MSDLTSILERLLSVAGEDFDSRDCRVTNPRITARESIVIADYIVALQTERDQLAAHVQQLRDAALNAVSFMSGGQAKADLRDAYDATPAKCLAEIKAQAGRDAVVSALRLYGEPTMAVSEIDSLADRYANQLRQQAKEQK